MRKLILLGEGSFGPALLDSTLAITGLEADEDTFAIPGDNVDRIRQTMDSICNTVHNKDSLLILCDAAMSKAMQEAWLILEKRHMIERMFIIAGANVPCVNAALRYKDQIASDGELSQVLLAEGRSGLTPIGI